MSRRSTAITAVLTLVAVLTFTPTAAFAAGWERGETTEDGEWSLLTQIEDMAGALWAALGLSDLQTATKATASGPLAPEDTTVLGPDGDPNGLDRD